MKATEEKDGTYTLSGLTYNQLTSVINGLGSVTESYKRYTKVQREVYKSSIKETTEMLETLDAFMIEGMD